MATTESSFKRIDVRDLGRWKLISDFQQRLAAVSMRHGMSGSFADSRRKMAMEHYLSLFLFGLLNPVVRTMRALCGASDIERLQRDICGRPVSLGSFSEAQAVLDMQLLKAVFEDLVGDVDALQCSGSGTKLKDAQVMKWIIVDSTLWEVLPRMHWAFWRQQGTCQNAVRLHVGLHVMDDHPVSAEVTVGKICERKAWRKQWKPGECYIGDRNYGENYKIFKDLDDLGCSFVLRLRESARYEIDQELPVEAADAKAGVIRSAWIYLGCSKQYRSMRVRLVWVKTQEEEILILVTNRSEQQLGGELVSELYRRRWQVELFFRWIKCILGNRHWLAESKRGVSIQIYLALIGALLLQLHGSMRPSKRMMERIQLYLMGMATLDELEAGLEREMVRMKNRAKTKNRSREQ